MRVHWLGCWLVLCLPSGFAVAGTAEEQAFPIFKAAKEEIVANCLYRPKPEQVVWGALAGLAKQLGPDYAKYFPEKMTGSEEEAWDAYEFTLRILKGERQIPLQTSVVRSLQAYCRSVDRYSDYDDAETWAKLQKGSEFEFDGIGVTLVARAVDGFILITFPNSPAERAGVVNGDLLLEVAGVSVRGPSMEEVQCSCRGKEGTKVTLKVRHADNAEESFEIVREKLVVSPLKVDQTAAGLRVTCRAVLAKAVEQFRTLLRSHTPDEELTLDLRGCSVGTVDAAVAMASLFLPSETLIGRLKSETKQVELRYDNNTPFRPAKLIILQDRFTASAAELVTVALVGSHSFPVETRGERSFGKGITQCQRRILDDKQAVAGNLRMTDMRMFGPNNEEWDSSGLMPTAKKH